MKKGNANKKHEDNTSSSGCHSPEWKNMLPADRGLIEKIR